MKKETVENQENKAPVSKAKKTWKIIGNVIMWLFIAFCVMITIFAFSAQSNTDGVPTVGGKVMSPVLTESMSPTIKQGDIIFSRKLEDDEKPTLKVGDIITYRADINKDGVTDINTHRIVEIIEDGDSVKYQTKGDNNQFNDDFTVATDDVISIFDPDKDTRIPLLGSFISFLLQPTGFFIVIVIPLILFFLFEIIIFVRKVMKVNNSDKKQITAADEELIKQKAIEEYLRSQAAASEKTDENGDPDDSAGTPPDEAPDAAEAEAPETEKNDAE
ncbi:MAG: signal peptidase I [Clostridia bacterium]|nr:signal peptidase I [Clostridia bacterium]